MAEGSITATVSLEAVACRAFMEVAQEMFDKHGLLINDIDFKWFDSGTIVTTHYSLESVNISARVMKR